MKVFLLALFVVAAVAAPTPEEASDNVEVIVNGVPEGQPLEIGDIVDIKLKEHVNGQLASSTNVLHPYTAEGLAEIAAAAEAEAVLAVERPGLEQPKPIEPELVPTPVVLPQPPAPEVIAPEPVVLPEPFLPEGPQPVVLPSPTLPEVILEPVVPEAVVLPEPALPEVVPEAIVVPAPVAPELIPEPTEEEQLPVPAPQVPGEIFNDGGVQVSVNIPEPSMLSSIQSWFNMVVNYITNGVQYTTQQIV